MYRPYAAKAIIEHDFDTNHLDIFVTFRFSMDQTVKPPNAKWICEADDVEKAVTVSAWLDAWTLHLTVADIAELPGKVTLEYEGPDDNLKTTWNKQWEPWGPILSIRIPYNWEDILVVDTVNKRVGIQPGVVAAAAFAYALTVVSHDGNDQIGMYHDNINGFIKWSNGVLNLQTVEGTNSSTSVYIKGQGAGYGFLYIFNQDDSEYIRLYCYDGTGYLEVAGAAPAALALNAPATVPIEIFRLSSEGETQEVKIYGFRVGDAKRFLEIGVGVDAPDTASFDGLSNYWFDGNVISAGRLVSDALTHSTVGPTDNLDVSGVNTVFIDCSANNVTIGGFLGGINGQVLHIIRLCAAVNDATLEHNEGTGNQDIFLHKGLDETLTGEYGGWTLVCNGSHWFDVSHAKHV